MVQSKTVEIAKEDFPDDPRGLSMFDLLIVNGIDCGTLDQAQKEAVADWVSDGGTLILGTGKNGGKTLELLSECRRISRWRTRRPCGSEWEPSTRIRIRQNLRCA